MKYLKKLIAVAGFICLASVASAAGPDSATQMMGLCGFDPVCAKKIVTIVNTLASPFPNATYVTFRNAANSANIDVLKVDNGDETVLNADTGDATHFSVAGTDVAVVSASALTMSQDVAFASGMTVALQEATAGSACSGTLTCNGASDVATSTTCATTTSRIFLTRTSLDTDTSGDFYVKSISNGVSFTVACEASDTATLNWVIFHEAP